MKRTKRLLLVAVCCIVSFLTPAYADNEKPIQATQLPSKAQTVIASHFKGQKVSHATVESDITSRQYEVTLQNGVQLEFDKKGTVTKVDCKRGTVPEKMIPQRIREHVKTNYPGATVRKYEIDKKEHEVELSNGVEITFDKNFRVKKVD